MVYLENIEDLHKSVLLKELVSSIDIFSDKKNVIIDCTLGLWWHASEIIKKMNLWDIFVGFDADIENLDLAKIRLEKLNKNKKIKLIFINSNFINLKIELEKLKIKEITWIYYDLWMSSVHIDKKDRWFSFKFDWPLDMRFDRTIWKTAADILNWYKIGELRNIFLKYWEEPISNKLSYKIIEERKNNKFKRSTDLVRLIEDISKSAKSKNRIFQALRIEVNNELENIKISIEDAVKLLIKNGNIFVISFHSLEDRIVKRIFKKEARNCICKDLICTCKHKKTLQLLTKKPILPTEKEIKNNKRSRSAKARIAKKI